MAFRHETGPCSRILGAVWRKCSSNLAKVGGKTGYPVKTRLFGTCYNLTPDGLDGDARSFFGSSGSLAVQAANVERDSDEISRELMGMALAETPQLECFPSLSLVIPKIQDNALHHQQISSANTAMPSTIRYTRP